MTTKIFYNNMVVELILMNCNYLRKYLEYLKL